MEEIMNYKLTKEQKKVYDGAKRRSILIKPTYWGKTIVKKLTPNINK